MEPMAFEFVLMTPVRCREVNGPNGKDWVCVVPSLLDRAVELIRRRAGDPEWVRVSYEARLAEPIGVESNFPTSILLCRSLGTALPQVAWGNVRHAQEDALRSIVGCMVTDRAFLTERGLTNVGLNVMVVGADLLYAFCHELGIRSRWPAEAETHIFQLDFRSRDDWNVMLSVY